MDSHPLRLQSNKKHLKTFRSQLLPPAASPHRCSSWCGLGTKSLPQSCLHSPPNREVWSCDGFALSAWNLGISSTKGTELVWWLFFFSFSEAMFLLRAKKTQKFSIVFSSFPAFFSYQLKIKLVKSARLWYSQVLCGRDFGDISAVLGLLVVLVMPRRTFLWRQNMQSVSPDFKVRGLLWPRR